MTSTKLHVLKIAKFDRIRVFHIIKSKFANLIHHEATNWLLYIVVHHTYRFTSLLAWLCITKDVEYIFWDG